MAALEDVTTASRLYSIISGAGNNLVVLHFSAQWATQCQQMNNVLAELAKDPHYVNIRFAKIESEDLPEISEKYKISAVPTFIFLKNNIQLDRLDGANAAELTKKVNTLSTAPAPSTPTEPLQIDLNTRLKNLINSAPAMLFMKGTVQEQRCGFSKQIVKILDERNIEYSSFNILTDESVRQGLKTYSNWPTYPQLYVNGELIGGLDIVKELAESGELEEQLPKTEKLENRLKRLINQAPVMLFMKGYPQAPRCGFSKTIIAILNETKIPYGTFDILTDEVVRQELKKFSNWPTYPQLYVKGDLIGGLDIVKELQESGDLIKTLKGEEATS